VSAYYISKVVADTPFRLVAPLVFGVISYWMVGLNSDAGDFFIFMSALWTISMTMSSFGLAISSIAKTPQIAVALSTLLMVFYIVFGGFFITADNIPGIVETLFGSKAKFLKNHSHKKTITFGSITCLP